MIIADLTIAWPNSSIEATAREVDKALGVELVKDSTGDFEEFEAYSCSVMGLRVALLKLGVSDTSSGIGEGKFEYQLLVESHLPFPHGREEEHIDISRHVKSCFDAQGSFVARLDPLQDG